jgi:hypothetical protein
MYVLYPYAPDSAGLPVIALDGLPGDTGMSAVSGQGFSWAI